LQESLAAFPFDDSQECDRELREAIAALLTEPAGRSGCSMWEAIRVHHHTGRPPTELRELLNRFVDVCNAIAYAHSRCVIHRDLKPENVMLGEFGETLVVDWGLAKVVDRSAHNGDVSPQQNHRNAAISLNDASMTLDGTIMGTPGYMSPEQAEGSSDAAGFASDVYGLGGILYAILTGGPPHRGRSEREVLAAAREGRIRPPSELAADVPKPLEAVCLKALSKGRDQRYARAEDLAADIGRWLADEPVKAWQEPISVQAQRWVRKHQGVVSTVVAVVVLATVLLSLMVAVVGAKNEDLASLNTRLNRQNDDLTHLNTTLDQRNQDLINSNMREQEARGIAQQKEQAALASHTATRQLLYTTDIGIAWQHVNEGDLHTATEILDRYIEGDSLTGQDYRGMEWWLLNHRMRPAGDLLATGLAQGSLVRYSPDGDRLVLGWEDGSVQLKDAVTGRTLTTFRGHTSFVNGCDFHPDGSMLATIDENGVICLWDLTNLQPLRSIAAFEGRGDRVFFNRDGTQLISSGGVGGVRFWDVNRGELVTTLEPQNVSPETGVGKKLGYSRDRNAVVLADDSGIIRTYDADTHTVISESAVNPGGGLSGLRCLRLSPNGRFAAGGCLDNRVCVWDAGNGFKLAEYRGHRDDVLDFAFHPHLPLLFSCDRAGVVRCWKMSFAAGGGRATPAERAPLAELITVPPELEPGAPYRIAFLSSRLISGESADNGVYNTFVTDMAHDVPQLAALGTHWRAIVSTPAVDALTNTATNTLETSAPIYLVDGTRIAGNNGDLWNGNIDTPINVTERGAVIDAATVWTGTNNTGWGEAPLGSSAPRRGATNLSDAGWINIGPTPDSISALEHVYAISGVLAVPEPTSLALAGRTMGWPTVLKAHEDRIRSLDVSPQGTQLATASRDRTFRTWNSLQFDSEPRLNVRNPEAAVFFDGGRQLVVTGQTELCLWSAETGEVRQIELFEEPSHSVAVTDDGRTAFTSHPGWLRAWDLETGSLLAETSVPGGVFLLDISGDGKWVVSSEDNRSNLRRWDHTQRQFSEVTPLKDYEWGWFAPDGETLIVTHDNELVAIHPQSFEVLTTFSGHENTVNQVAFSPDGTLLASGSHDRSVRIWDLKSGELLQTIFAHAGHVTAVAFSADGQSVVSGDVEGNIAFSRVAAGQVLFMTSVPGHIWIKDIDFSADGRYFTVVRFPHVYVFPTHTSVSGDADALADGP
jgi:WD40 repeat protein/serine/threonine protein kinase